MADVTLYTVYPSIYGRAVLIALEEKGVAYDVEIVDTSSTAHRARHPFAKIPVLEHTRDGAVVTIFESLAVARYVDEAFDGPALQPTGAAERAHADQWIEVVKSYAFPAIVTGIVKPLLAGEEPANETVGAAHHVLAPLDAALATDSWLGGTAPGLADCFALPVVEGLVFFEQLAGLLAGYPALSDWLERMEARPSVAGTLGPRYE